MLQLATASQRDDVNRLACQIHDLHVSYRPDLFEHCPERYSEDSFLVGIKNRNIYVAMLEDQVVGYVLLTTHPRQGAGLVTVKVMEIVEFCVDEALRGHGIGKTMMEDVHALARAFGCDRLLLGVHPENDGAVAFYQKCGFMIRTIHMDSIV